MPQTLTVSNDKDSGPEIFASIQGEGINVGAPTAFLRLAHCNLSCIWCDTKYTWDWQKFDIRIETRKMDLSEIEALIDNLHMSRLVITGGEPLMQQGNLRELLVNLYNKGYSLEIETNGTIQPDSILVEVTEFWNVSPKMSNSLLDFNVRIRNNALKEFAKLPNAYFKFVIQDSADIAEVKKMIDVFRIPKERIFLMPQGNTMALINRINYWLLPICVSEGYRYSPRLHIALWEDQRGR